MSGVRSKRLLSSETEYFGYLENSEEQYGDYYDGNIVEHSLEYNEEIGLCVKIKLHLNNFSMFQVNEDSEFRLALCLPIIIVFIFLR